jgi:hypothetical protein
MATTAVKKSKARPGLVQSARMGPFSLFTALAGAVVGGLAFAGLVAGTRAVLERNDSSIDLSQAWDGLGRRSAMVLVGLLFLSYLLAAFVAGRIAWRRGWLRGLAAEIDIRDRIEAEAASASQPRADTNGASNSDFDVDIDGLNKEELYGMAQELDIAGRSQMTKEDLARSVRRELRTESRSR